MLSFKNFLTEIIKNEIGKDKKLPHSTKFDPKGEHAGYERESVVTNTGHHIYTITEPQLENDEPGYVHHIWVHPKTGHVNLSVEASTIEHPNGRTTYTEIYTRGRERIEGSQNNSPSNMAAHGYNDLHKLGVITHHESQSPGAQKIQKSLRKLYPETNPIYHNPETDKSYPISHVRPFMKPSGNRKPWPLAKHAFDTNLSVSTEKVNKKRLERNKKLRSSRDQ